MVLLESLTPPPIVKPSNSIPAFIEVSMVWVLDVESVVVLLDSMP